MTADAITPIPGNASFRIFFALSGLPVIRQLKIVAMRKRYERRFSQGEITPECTLLPTLVPLCVICVRALAVMADREIAIALSAHAYQFSEMRGRFLHRLQGIRQSKKKG
jgi:hypothetical protein